MIVMTMVTMMVGTISDDDSNDHGDDDSDDHGENDGDDHSYDNGEDYCDDDNDDHGDDYGDDQDEGNDDHGDSDGDDQVWPDVEAADCDLLGGVDICGLSGHEVQETIELHVAGGVGVHNRQDTLEVNLSLLVLSYAVSKGDQAVLEFLGIETASSVKLLVKY